MENDDLLSQIVIRQATLQEFTDFVLPLAHEEEWNEYEGDIRAHYDMDPEGFIIATIGTQTIASVSFVRHTPEFAIFGYVLVAPQYRRKGVMNAIFAHALCTLYVPGMIVSLDSDLPVESFYARNGFQRSYFVQHFEGVAATHTLTDVPSVTFTEFDQSSSSQQEISALYKYDKEFYPYDRKKFFDNMHKLSAFTCVVAKQGARVVAWAMLRPGDEMYRVQPVYANSVEMAEHVVRRLVNKIPAGEKFCMWTQNENADVVEKTFAPLYGLERHWQLVRMYMGGGEVNDGKEGDKGAQSNAVREGDTKRMFAIVD